MCKLCLSPTTRDLLMMVAVYTIVAIFLITASGCAEEIRPRGPVVVVKPLDTSALDILIARNIERMRIMDCNIARLNAVDEHLDQLLSKTRHTKAVPHGAR